MTTATVIGVVVAVVCGLAGVYEWLSRQPPLYDETPEPYESGATVICLDCGRDRRLWACVCEEPTAELHYEPEEAA